LFTDQFDDLLRNNRNIMNMEWSPLSGLLWSFVVWI